MINYKVIQRGQPGVAGGGTKKHYAIIDRSNKVTLDELTERIAEISPVSTLDTKSTLLSFIEVLPKFLAQGRPIDLGELGQFSVTIQSDGVEAVEDFSSSLIKGNKIHFRPGVKIKKVMREVKYSRN